MSSEFVELIKKLLNMTPENGCTEAEAAVAMAKAQELLIKHNLDLADIKAPTEDDTNEIGLINEIVDFSDYQSWQAHLLNVVSKRNFCHSIKTGQDTLRILGRKANVRAVVEMYNWLEPQVIRLINHTGYKRGDKTSYAYGICSTIAKKLDESKEQYQVNNPNSRALIVNIQSESDKWFKQQYPYTTSSRVSIHQGAFSHGKSDGSGVWVYNSSRQVGGRLLLA